MGVEVIGGSTRQAKKVRVNQHLRWCPLPCSLDGISNTYLEGSAIVELIYWMLWVCEESI